MDLAILLVKDFGFPGFGSPMHCVGEDSRNFGKRESEWYEQRQKRLAVKESGSQLQQIPVITSRLLIQPFLRPWIRLPELWTGLGTAG